MRFLSFDAPETDKERKLTNAVRRFQDLGASMAGRTGGFRPCAINASIPYFERRGSKMNGLDLVVSAYHEVIGANPSVHPMNKLNDLTAKEWIARTISVFVQKGLGKSSEDAIIERQHPAPFSFQDVAKFIEFFTKAGEVVLDPFSGVGSTLKACATTGRAGIGVELSPRYAALSRKRLETELDSALFARTALEIREGDIRTVAPTLAPASVSFIVTSPPYWGILNKVDHKAQQERLANGWDHNYGTDGADLALIEGYDDFVSELGAVFHGLSPTLRSKRYMVVIVGDFRNKDRYHMFHSDLASQIERRGTFALKGITIIYQKFKRVFPYGYPHAFVPNIHHQYAMVFQKRS